MLREADPGAVRRTVRFVHPAPAWGGHIIPIDNEHRQVRVFQLSLVREMTATGATALVALSAIVLVSLMVRILGKAAIGDINPEAVFPFIGFGLLNFLPVLLSLALFMGVFLTLTRLWRDSEMVIWTGAGLSPWFWLSPVMRLAVPVVGLIALLSLALIPWSARQQADYEHFLSSRDEGASLVPGAFMETGEGKRVIFVESLDRWGEEVGNVFIQSIQQGRIGVIVGRSGVVSNGDNGDRFLVLHRGRRYEGAPGSAEYRVMEFERYAIRLQPGDAGRGAPSARMLDSRELLRNPTLANLAEGAWRIGFPISALLLAALAIPLSHVNPRAGRSMNILLAILIYTTYNNLIGLSEGWIGHGKLGAVESMVLIHGGMLALMLTLFGLQARRPPRGT